MLVVRPVGRGEKAIDGLSVRPTLLVPGQVLHDALRLPGERHLHALCPPERALVTVIVAGEAEPLRACILEVGRRPISRAGPRLQAILASDVYWVEVAAEGAARAGGPYALRVHCDPI